MDAATRLPKPPTSTLKTSPTGPASPRLERDLEACPIAPAAPASQGVLSRTQTMGRDGFDALQGAFLARAEPVTGALTGLHTISLVVREALPAYVASPVMGIAGAATKLVASVGGAHAAKLTQAWSSQTHAHEDLSTTSQALLTILPRTAGVGLTLAALVSFPTAEAAALSVAAAGQAVQNALQTRGVARWKRNVLAVACQAAVLLTREAVFNTSTGPTARPAPSPYLLSAAACNGAAENCAAQWCDVVFPATHNSMMQPTPFAHMSWPLNQVGRFASNQARSVESQFADGIRGFLVEYYQNDKGELRTSHNTVFDREPLVETLARFTKLLAAHPRDFITLELSQQPVGGFNAQVPSVYQASGLAAKTMQDTCQKGGQSAVSAPPCRLSMGSLLDLGVQVATIERAVQNRYDANTLAGLGCDASGFVESISVASSANRSAGTAVGPFWVDGQLDDVGAKFAPVTWNAFVSLAMPSVSAVVNSYLPNFVAKCAVQSKSDVGTPTLLAVNHYESSDVVAIAHGLNTQSYKRKGDVAICGISPDAS